MNIPLIIPSRKIPEREQWWVMHDQTGKMYGPFDPGTLWFETPLALKGYSLLNLQRRTDIILNAAAGGWEQLQQALAFMQPHGAQAYRRFMETGLLPRQTAALAGISGGLDTNGYLGNGAATGASGLHVDDSKNDTTFAGGVAGAGGTSGHMMGNEGAGVGGGVGGGSQNVAVQGGGGGGGHGAAGADGGVGTSGAAPGGAGGKANFPLIWEAMRTNTWDLATLLFGGGGAGGGYDNTGTAGNGGAGGNSGVSYIEIVNGILTTVARSLVGAAGSNGLGDGGGDGGGGSGGLWVGIAATIAYGADTIATDGGAGATGGGGGNGGAGSDGRIIQVYFDAKATLTVSGASQNQYRILRSVPLGQAVFL